MSGRTPITTAYLMAMLGVGCAVYKVGPTPESDAQLRAIAYLSREVPAWNTEHKCFSCHNNGDAAAALLWASPMHRIDLAVSIHPTMDWLSRPQDWHENKGDPAYSDFKLARLQFGGALANANNRHWITDRKPLLEAARQIALDQDEDGSWKIEADSSPGSPVTYGNTLATIKAASILRVAEASAFEVNIKKAAAWLRDVPLENIPTAASVAMWFGQSEPYGDSKTAGPALDYLRQAQSTTTGGWGPYPGSPAESFDTSLAVMAMDFFPNDRDASRRAKLGRRYLVSEQLPEGGWPETTRPSGDESYAQHISTTAWALMALVPPSEIRPLTLPGVEIIVLQTEPARSSPRSAR